MTIHFACQCGKRLQAPERSAGQRTQCPACFNPVVVPGGRRWRPSQREADGSGKKRTADDKPRPAEHDSPAVPAFDETGPFAAAPSPGETFSVAPGAAPSGSSTFVPTRTVSNGLAYVPNSIALRHPPRWMRLVTRYGEARWYHNLLFPVAQVPVFFKLASMLTVLTALALLGWLSIDHHHRQVWPYGLLAVSLFFLLLVMGRTLNYFNAIVALAVRGKVKHEAPIDFAPLQALLGCAQWLACFLAGPAFLLGGALGYWMYGGDLTVIDWLILAELGIAAVGWWLIAILLINADDTIRVPLPGQVLETALGLRWKSVELTLLASAVCVVHFLAAVNGIGHLHDQFLSSFLLLCVSATTGFYLTAFTFRRLGLAFYRAEKRRKAAEAQPSDANGPADQLARGSRAAGLIPADIRRD